MALSGLRAAKPARIETRSVSARPSSRGVSTEELYRPVEGRRRMLVTAAGPRTKGLRNRLILIASTLRSPGPKIGRRWSTARLQPAERHTLSEPYRRVRAQRLGRDRCRPTTAWPARDPRRSAGRTRARDHGTARQMFSPSWARPTRDTALGSFALWRGSP